MEKAWYKEGVVYQIYPRSFYDSNNDGIGDLQGIIQKIPYIKSLGVDIVWLSPVYMSPMEDNGYDISDYTNIAPEFGTLDDIKELIKKFHEVGIKLLMDLVVNHTSDEHEWFKKSVKREGKYTDYYHWEKRKVNWGSFFGGKAWSYNDVRQEYYLHLFTKGQPDLNWDNPEVRREVKDIIKFWLDLGVDGFRCDVINLIAKDNTHPKGKLAIAIKGREHYLKHPNLHKYLKEINDEVFSKYDMFTVGETAFVDMEEAIKLTDPKRHELSMVFQFDHMAADAHYVKWLIKKFKPINLKKPLAKWQNGLNGKGWNSLYLENHDQGRSISRFGNINLRYESGSMLATMLYFQQGTPFIYQGQELGMINAYFDDLDKYRDIETFNIYKLGRKLGLSHKRMMKKIKLMGRDNARTPMHWDNSNNGGFTKGTPWIDMNPTYKDINIKNEINNDKSMLNYYKKIIELRKKYPVIVYGDYFDIDFKNKKFYIYKRKLDKEEMIVICNFTNNNNRYEKLDFIDYELILNNYANPVENEFKPYEARVYYKKMS